MKEILSKLSIFEERLKIMQRIEDMDKYKNNRLHLEVKSGRLSVVVDLLKKGFNPSSVNIHGQTPLMFAARYNKYNEAINIMTNIRSKIFIDCVEIADLPTSMLEKEINTRYEACLSTKDRFGHDALSIACIEGNEKLASLLINMGARIDSIYYDGKDLLNLVIELHNGSSRIKELNTKAEITAFMLIDMGVFLYNVDKFGNNAFYLSCGYGHVNIVKKLLDKGITVNANNVVNNNSPLFIAAENGHLEIVKLLIENGATIDTKNKHGEDAMYIAIHKKHKDVVDYLYSKGMRYTVKD